MAKWPFLDTLRNYLPLKDTFFQNRWPLTVGIISLLLVDFLQLLIPLVIRRAVDALTLGAATPALLLHCGAMIVAIAAAMALFRYIWRHLLFGHSRKVEEGLRNRLYAHLQTLSPAFYHKMKTGDLMARSTNDINAVRMATGIGLVALTDGLVLGVAAIGFMVYINPFLTLIALVFAPIIITFTRILTRRMSVGYDRVQRRFSDLTERVREAFAGIRVVKVYGREGWVYRKVEEEGGHYLAENLRLARTLGLFYPSIAVFTNVGLAVVIWMGGRLTILGHITTGDFVAFISYLNLLTWPMLAIGWVTNLIQRGSVSMRRINHILQEVPEIADPPGHQGVSRIKGTIRFEGLTFMYPGLRAPALKGIRVTIEQGQTVALVGRVGSGKTTLLQIIPHLFTIPPATVFVDDIDIEAIPLHVLRGDIGFVTQEVVVFSDTVRNNVLFGRKGVSDETLRRALKDADFYEEVLDFKDGPGTLLGERGLTLSGGQRQRLTIARALISEHPILILDDALSMVDTRTEERILNRILERREDKTNLIVSHRLSTITRADLVLVLEKGALVEQGEHESLLKEGKEYARLYRKQLIAQELDLGGA
jgi:ATP-binding cassette subfamily B multidrug efflux pump